MKRLVIFIGVVIIAFFIFSILNDPPESKQYMEGYIVEAGFMRQLVVSGITKEQAGELSRKELLALEDISAVWVSKYNFFQYREGQKVRVWIEGSTAESFPEQAKAEYIEVISD